MNKIMNKEKPNPIKNQTAGNIPPSRLEKIESFIQEGRLSEARQEIAAVRRMHKLAPFDREKLSDFYLRMSDVPGAFKALSEAKQKALNPLITISQARLLNQIGAWRAALRKLNSSVGIISPAQNRTIAEIYLTLYEFKKGLPYAEILVQQEKEMSPYRHMLDQILLADLHEGVGNWEEACRIVQSIYTKANDKMRILKAICLQAQSEYYIKANKTNEFAACEGKLKEALDLFTSENSTKDRAYTLKWLGALYIQLCQPQRAQPHLEEALQILLETKTRATAIIEVLYWLSEVRTLDASELLILNFYPVPTNWRKIQPGDSVLIRNGQAVSVFYDRTDLSGLLDFFTLPTISKQDLKICILILSSGSFGVSIYSLMDQIFESDFIDIKYGLKRIEFSLSKIEKILPLKRKNNWVSVAEIPTFCIFPKLEFVNDVEILRLKKLNSDFSMNDIMKLLNISAAKANNLRKLWLSKNHK